MDIEALAKHEAYKESQNEWRKLNQNKVKEYNRKAYLRNRDEVIQKHKDYKDRDRQHFNSLRNARNRRKVIREANKKWPEEKTRKRAFWPWQML